MLHVKLGNAFSFLPHTDIDPEKAMLQLLGESDPSELNISEELLQGMIGEWLLFEYKPKSGRSLIEQYYFADPDKLNTSKLSELQQIIETNSLHLLQSYAPAQPPYVFLQSVFSGKKLKVYDKTLSQTIDSLDGSFFGRISKVGQSYYLVGSNPVGFPMRYTQRAINNFAKDKSPSPSLKDVITIISKPKQDEAIKKINLDQERKKLKKHFNLLAKKFHATASFEAVVAFINEEKYEHNFADFFRDLLTLGIPEKMYLDKINLFQDMWNYFPHQQLGNRCPHEVYQEAYGQSK